MKVGMCLILFAMGLIIPVVEMVDTGNGRYLWMYDSVVLGFFLIYLKVFKPFK